MNKEFNYSLCLALPNLQGSDSFYRIADYDPQYREFTQAKYDYTSETPVQIYSSKVEGIAQEVKIRKWILSDELKQMSFYHELRFGYIYEVLFSEELIHQPLSDKQLRQVLYNGISLPEGIARYFLLVLDVTSESYRVLLCDKKAFKYEEGKYHIEKQIRDLKNTVTEFDLIYIYNDQLISTETLRNKLKWYNPDKLRYFFNSVILPESTEKFQLRDPEDYTIGFFSNYLKNTEMRNKYSKRIRANLMTELEYIENNYTIVERFFVVEGEKLSVASDIFIENITNIIDFIKRSEITEMEFLLEILEKSPLISNALEEKIEAKWMLRANENLLKKENELQTVEAQYDEKKKELNRITTELTDIEVESKAITNELKELMEKKATIETQIKQELTSFQKNIVEQFKLSAFAGASQANSGNNSGVIEHIPENFENVDLQTSDSIVDVFEGIKYNLENFMDTSNAQRYTTILIALLNTHKFIILPEFHSEDIANALSLIVTGKPVKTISILNECYDLNWMIEQIHHNEDRYVLIKGHLDMFNESAVNTLINQSKNKNIIFTINDEKSLSLFSDNLWNYCGYLNPIDHFDLALEKHWKKSNEINIDVSKADISTEKLSSNFYSRMTEECLFTRYVQEEFLYIMEVYTALYKEIIDKHFEMTTMKNMPLNHQILTMNRERISELESYLNRLGIEEDLLKYYK